MLRKKEHLRSQKKIICDQDSEKRTSVVIKKIFGLGFETIDFIMILIRLK